VVNGGTLNLGADDRLLDTAAVSISSGTLGMGTFTDRVGAFTISGGTLGGSGTLTASTYALLGGAVDAALGAGAVTVSGGTTTLGSAGRFNSSSSLTVNSGQLTLGGNETVATLAGSAGTVALGTNRLTVGGNTSTTFSGVISGASGGLTKTGTGALTLEGNNTYTGATRVEDGSLIAANNNSFSSSAVTMTDGSVLAEAGVTLANNFTIGTASVTGDENVFVAGWDFQTTANGGTAIAAAPDTPTTIFANYGEQAGSAAIYLDGSNGSFAFATNQLSAFGGTALNATNTFVSPTETMSTTTSGAAALAVINVGGTVNGERIVFTLDMSGLKDLQLSYASQRSNNGFTSQVWSYSTNAISWTDFFTNDTVETSFAVTNAATLTALNNGGNVYIGLTLSGASSGNNNNRLDNIVVNAVTQAAAASGTGTLGVSEAGSATFTGSVTVNNTATFTAATGGLANFSGVVSGTGTALSKTGAGTVTLSGASANTFTGMTTVTAGTLQLNKTAGTDALAGAVTVNSGAVLLIAASNQVKDGSAVSLSGGTIRTAAGVNEVFGNLSVIGSGFLDFGATSFETANTISFGAYTPSALLTIDNFNFGSTLTFGTDLTGTIGESSLFQFENGGFASTSWDGSTFTITAIPEPSTYLAAAGLIGLMLWPSRKRLLKDAKKILGLTPPMRDRLAKARQ
jgi:fibronectin-binding autotransporter adhesin